MQNANFKMNLKPKTYTCRLLPLLMVAVMLSACVNTLELAVPKGGERAGVTHEGAVANAREFFNTHFGNSTRSEEQQPTPEAPYVVGNLVPDWESGVTVANEEKCYTDFAMQKDYRYFLLLGEEESEQMQAVELYSRFVSVEDIVNGITSQYVATYIPDEEYLNSYGAAAQDYGINCAEWYEFSGVVLYTLPHGHHVAAYRYKEGELVAESFLYDSEQTTEQNIADFMAVTEGIRVSVGELSEGTRSDALYGGTIEEIVIVYDTGFPIFIIDNTDIWETGNHLTEPFDNFHIVYGGGGGGTTTTEEEDKEDEDFEKELVEDLFDTSNLTDEQVKEVGKMLMEIIRDCMGDELYRQLKAMYKKSGDILTIVYAPNNTEDSMTGWEEDGFDFQDNISQTITIGLFDATSDVLLHEMFHAYQMICGITDESFSAATANHEIEAQLSKYLYGLRNRDNIQLSESFELYNTEGTLWYNIADLTAYTNGVSIFNQKQYEIRYRFIIQQYLGLESDVKYTYTPPVNVSATISNLSELSIKCQ